MPTLLKDLVITKVALVDEGACSDAHIKFFKRKEGGNKNMTVEEIIKSLPADQQTVINKALEDAKAELPEGALSAEDKAKLDAQHNAEMQKAKQTAKVTSAEGDAETLLKSADLDPAVKAILESQIAKAKASEIMLMKMQEERDQATFLAKAKEVNLIPEAESKVVDLLKSIKGVDGAVDAVMDILKSANTLIEKGKVFGEVGTGEGANVGTSSAEAWDAIEKAANALVVKGQVSKEKSIEMVINQQPELYNAYVNALKSE